MAGTATHLAEGVGRGTRDLSSKRRTSLRFLVDVPAPNVFVGGNPVATTGLAFPNLGTIHPIDPTYGIADSYDVSEVPESATTHAYVDVLYSNDRSFRLNPRPDRTNPSFKTWEGSITEVEVEIPYVFGKAVVMPEDPQSTIGYDYDIRAFKVTETRAKYTRSVVLQSFDTSTIAAIKRQHNTLHLIGGQLLRCEVAASILQSEDAPGIAGTWETTYSWHDDSGTVRPSVSVVEGPSPLPIYGLPGVVQEINIGPRNKMWTGPHFFSPLAVSGLVNDAQLYARPPFHRVEAVLQDNQSPPKFIVCCPYRVDGTTQPPSWFGWQTLPGFTP